MLTTPPPQVAARKVLRAHFLWQYPLLLNDRSALCVHSSGRLSPLTDDRCTTPVLQVRALVEQSAPLEEAVSNDPHSAAALDALREHCAGSLQPAIADAINAKLSTPGIDPLC
jgi:hypothetical protein